MEVFSNFQIIPSIRRLTDLDTALESGAQVILLTDADITNLQVLTQKIHAAGKQVWINTELLGGFGKDQAGLKLLKNYYKVDGVMSTDSARLKTLRHMGLYTVQRFFMTDSRSFETSLKLLKNSGMDAAEILPACARQERTNRSGVLRQFLCWPEGLSPAAERRSSCAASASAV